MRRGVRTAAIALAASLAACGEEPGTPEAPAPAPHDVAAPAARARAATRGADTAADAELQRLLAAWSAAEAGGDASREALAADAAALGDAALPALLDWFALEDGNAQCALAAAALAKLVPESTAALLAEIRDGAGARRRGAILALLEFDASWPWEAHGPDAARAVLAALADADVTVRTQALVALGKAGPTGVPVAEAVAARVGSELPDEVENALDALLWLASHGSAGAAATPLLDAIESGKLRRDHGFRALWNVRPGSPEAAARLAAMLRTSDEEERECAVAVLEGWRDGARPALPDLLRVAESEGDPLAQAAMTVIVQIPGAVEAEWARILRLARGDPHTDEGGALARAAKDSPDLAARLRDALPTLPPADARVALDVLTRAAVPGLDAAALRLTGSADANLRFAAVLTLCDSPDAGLDPVPLRHLLDDPDARVRAAAAVLIVERDPAWRDRAASVTASLARSGEARLWVTRALLAVADPAAPGPDLLDRLLGTHVEHRIPIEAMLARSDAPLGAVRREVLDTLVSDAFYETADRRNAARAALRCEGGAEALVRMCAEILRGTSADELRRALDVVEILGPRAAPLVPSLDEHRADEQHGARVRRLVAWLRGDAERLAEDLGDAPADIRRLLALGAAGGDALVRSAALWASWRAHELAREFEGDPDLAAALVRAAAPDSTGGSAVARAGAAHLAPALGRDRALDLLSRLATDAEQSVRFASVNMLARLSFDGIDVSPAAAALRSLLRDESADVRREACRAARAIGPLAPDLRARLSDEEAAVRVTAASEIVRDAPADAAAKTALFTALQSPVQLFVDTVGELWWDDVRDALAKVPLVADDAAVLAGALRSLSACDAQRAVLAGLARLGPDAAPALVPVRLALAGELSCIHGMHGETPNRAEAIAVLAAMGPAARPALPDLRGLLGDDDRAVVEAARRAIAKIDPAR